MSTSVAQADAVPRCIGAARTPTVLPGEEAEVSGGPVVARTMRGERTAMRLRAAARRVFAERGYAAARVEDVVAEAGVSHGTFYTYFENKAAALDALIDVTAAELQGVVEDPWEGPDILGTIAAVIDRFVAVFAEHADVVRAWLEAGAHEEHFRDRLRDVRQGYVDRVAENLEPALADTEHDPSVAAAALVAMVEGYATQGMTSDDPEQRASVVATLSAIWFGGLLRLVDPTV
jgi:AcrR family transcriptional regulator